jgi:NAD(P)-dependent dehydrogenase (short-subunit alcohol dehydrogenase family)
VSKSPARDLRGRVVAITGAGRGIGLATAARFADLGARVVIGDLDDDVAAKAAAQVGGGAEGYVVDVADRESFAAFLARAEEQGPLEVLVNNAGIMPLSPLVEQSEESIDRILDVNLRAVITGTQLAARSMTARGRGSIVNVASAVGRIGMAGGAVYSASKFGVVGFSEAMAGELAPHGVDVSVVLPTVVATELGVGVQATRGMRPCTPEEVAAAIVSVAQRPRFETWVPAYAKGIFYSSNTLPRRARDVISHAMGADTSLSHVDREARAEYERRAQR